MNERKEVLCVDVYLKHLIGAACVAILGVRVASSPLQAQTIAGTPHDLRSLTTSGADADLCAFCHTTIWNRNAPTGPFQAYTSATLDATSGAPSGVSAGCLSCHDGMTALDALKEPANIVLIIPGQTMTAAYPTSTTILGDDLSNHHPISISYGTAGGSGDLAFNAPTLVGSKVYVTSASDGAEIPLYGTAPGTVECTSCHNPHDNSKGKFQRTANTRSALCLACHIM